MNKEKISKDLEKRANEILDIRNLKNKLYRMEINKKEIASIEVPEFIDYEEFENNKKTINKIIPLEHLDNTRVDEDNDDLLLLLLLFYMDDYDY